MKRLIRGICALLVVLTAAAAVGGPVYALETIAPKREERVQETEAPVILATESLTVPATTVPTEPETVPTTAPTEAPTEPPTEPEETLPQRALYTGQGMPLYYMEDYKNIRYGHGTIATSGCSIISLAMVATEMTGYLYTPEELADYFGGYIGSNIDRLEYGSDQLQLPWSKAKNWHASLQALKEGKLVIVLMNDRSYFTEEQHFMVLKGITEDGKVLVHDPSRKNYDHWALKDGFENGFDQGFITIGYSGGWIYDPGKMPEEPFAYIKVEEERGPCRYPDFDLSESEIDLLARMIWVEAQGESVEGQQAVAEVVFNRLASDDYPDTIRAIIYAEGQFGSTPFLKDAKATQTQYEVIERALYGPYILPIEVTFFSAGFAATRNVWGDIGGHTFCYPSDWEG